MAQSDQREGRGSGSEEAQLASLEAGSTSLLKQLVQRPCGRACSACLQHST